MQPAADGNSHPTADQPSPMTLRVHLEGALSHVVGDEIWHESLAEVIAAEAETVTTYAGPDLLSSAGHARRDSLRDWLSAPMTSALGRPLLRARRRSVLARGRGPPRSSRRWGYAEDNVLSTLRADRRGRAAIRKPPGRLSRNTLRDRPMERRIGEPGSDLVRG
jgi:hypothetical protein